MEGLTKLLSGFQITDRGKGKLQLANKLPLTLMPFPVLQKSRKVTGIKAILHISYVKQENVWVSDDNANLILTNTSTGEKLYSVKNSIHSLRFSFSFSGTHTVNSAYELLYISTDSNINKFSNKGNTTIFIKITESTCEPQCVHCSLYNGDLLVGICERNEDTDTTIGTVRRYDSTGHLTQTIPFDNTTQTLYKNPRYITENHNTDVVVSDFDPIYNRGSVVVTSSEGKHRFSYTGPPQLESRLFPRGVCTDALSNILVCDYNTKTVHMLDQNGTFLKYLLTRDSPGIDNDTPWSLCYDINTHNLWVGTWSNTNVSVYKYLNRHITLGGTFLTTYSLLIYYVFFPYQ